MLKVTKSPSRKYVVMLVTTEIDKDYLFDKFELPAEVELNNSREAENYYVSKKLSDTEEVICCLAFEETELLNKLYRQSERPVKFELDSLVFQYEFGEECVSIRAEVTTIDDEKKWIIESITSFKHMEDVIHSRKAKRNKAFDTIQLFLAARINLFEI